MLLLLLTLVAMATTPTVSASTAVVANPYSPGNTMMFSVAAVVNAQATVANNDHNVTVGFSTSSSCSATAGTPSSPGVWTFAPTQVASTAGGTYTFTLYNFSSAGTQYYYKAITGDGTDVLNPYRARCGVLGTPTLPAGLAALNYNVTTSGTVRTNYVLIDTDDCSDALGNPNTAKDMLIAVSTVSPYPIVWYLDLDAMSDGAHSTGWRYQKGTGTDTGRILATIDHEWVYDWNFDGSTNNVIDIDGSSLTNNCDATSGDAGQCIGHDAFRSDSTGKTYVITSEDSTEDYTGTTWDPGCLADNPNFVDDGYSDYTGTTLNAQTFLMADYGGKGSLDLYDPADPVGTGNPTDGEGACDADYWLRAFDLPVLDWTHINSVSAYKPAGVEYVDVSLKEWNQIVRFDDSGVLKWSLSGDGSAAGSINLSANAAGISGNAAFGDQHDLHTEGGTDNFVFFDNTGNASYDAFGVWTGGASRAVQIAMTGGSAGSRNAAQIVKAWAMVNPTSTSTELYCPAQGSAELVPGMAASMLALCAAEYTVEEFTSANGDGATGHTPNFSISLPTTGVCDAGAEDGGTAYPSARTALHGWYRAYPISKVGVF